VHARESQSHPFEKSRQLQRRLYLAAKRSRNRRFHALYDRLVRPDILWRAWREVRANRGVAGVDGQSIEDVEGHGVERFLEELAEDLKAKRYRPRPVMRVYIPKPDGRRRPLGIPTVRDRVVERKEILERFRGGELPVVVASTLADEGLDVPRMDRVILAFPSRARGRTAQRLGRLM